MLIPTYNRHIRMVVCAELPVNAIGTPFAPASDLEFHHEWIRKTAEATGIESEVFLPEIAYGAAPFLL